MKRGLKQNHVPSGKAGGSQTKGHVRLAVSRDGEVKGVVSQYFKRKEKTFFVRI